MALLSTAFAVPALAQSSESEAERDSGDIIVTARKREESILKVPVILTAVSGEKLETLQVNEIMDLPRLVPTLLLGNNLLSIGPQISLRGIGTSSSDPGVDQSVSLNIDGLSLGHGLAYASGLFDVGQVEVLKGPQALFYGKSSPGGVLSLRTADPTSRFELIARAGYEIEARHARGELIVSGPVSETLGARLATTYSQGDGYFRNMAKAIPGTGARDPYERSNRPRNLIVRGTLLWKPDDRFSARLKINHSYDKATDPESNQFTFCPEPNEQFGFGSGAPGSPIPPAPNFLTPVDPIPIIVGDDCKLDRNIWNVYMDPVPYSNGPLLNNGAAYVKNIQNFGTLELNYELTPELDLTSTTAYYHLKSSSLFGRTAAVGPFLAVSNRFRREEFTQELRLNSSYSGPLNFTLGGFFQDGRLYDRVTFHRNLLFGFVPSAILNDDRDTDIDIKTYSIFGQLRYRLSDQLELAGGVRWNDETRSQKVFDFKSGRDLTPNLPVTRIHASNFSPEATLTYTPTDDLTLFASYKKGFKSGSFKVAVPAVAGEDNAFGDEEIEGYEFGLKSRLLENSLYLNLAFYDYDIGGLQVGGIVPAVNGVPVIKTVNAGKARTYGVDFDVSYRPPAVEGLSLNAALSWNRARYIELNNIGCYYNQTVAAGCVNFPNPTTLDPVTGRPRFTAQELGGTQIVRAPEWSGNIGFDYEMPIGSGLRLQIANNNQFSSKYPTFPAVNVPGNSHIQSGFVKVDANIALKGPDDRWEVALIGRNITNKLTASRCSNGNFSGGNFLGGNNTGGQSPSAAGLAETACYVDGARTVWVRLTLRPFN